MQIYNHIEQILLFNWLLHQIILLLCKMYLLPLIVCFHLSSQPYLYCYFIFLQAAIASLKTEYKEGQMTLDEAKKLAVKILSKTLDATKLTADKGILQNNKYKLSIKIKLN